MRLCLTLILLALSYTAAHAQSGPQPVFRNFIWGVTKEDVRKFEPALFYMEEGDMLYFLLKPETENDFRKLISYRFDNNHLVAARYDYEQLTHPDSQVIVSLYGDLQRKLSAEYGDDFTQELQWKDKTYLNYPQFWSRAILSRDLRMRSIWRGADAITTLELFHDGMFYKLFYTVTKAGTDAVNPAADILDLSEENLAPVTTP